MQRFSPGSLGGLHRQDEAPEHLALKTSRFHTRKTQVIVGNTDSTLAGHTQKSHMLWVPGQRQHLEKRPAQAHLLILGSLLERQVGPETPPGEGGDGGRHSGSSFYRVT